jgi:hypothetical protein
MKLWIAPTLLLLFLTGCNNTKQYIRLQNQNARQALIIQQQQARIEALTQQVKKTKKRRISRSSALPKAPKRNIKLKKVEDTNFNSDYMYPETKKRPKTTKTVKDTTSSLNMTRESCIAMIGEEKFNKYTEMFGNEAASIKRCAMLKAMKN